MFRWLGVIPVEVLTVEQVIFVIQRGILGGIIFLRFTRGVIDFVIWDMGKDMEHETWELQFGRKMMGQESSREPMAAHIVLLALTSRICRITK